MNSGRLWMLGTGALLALVLVPLSLVLFLPDAWAQAEASGLLTDGSGVGLGLVAAALSTGLAAIGAGIAVAQVGSAAVGVMAEKPELLGRMLLMIGLAEGIAIYGLIVSILILDRLG